MKMTQSRLIFAFIFLILFSISIIYEAHAHSMFNSAESTIGDFRVQIATLPEIPSNGEPMQILFRVTDRDYEEVDRFTMGVRIFYNDIYIFRVDLYDVAKDGGVLTYIFNISTQHPFVHPSTFSITPASMGLGAIL